MKKLIVLFVIITGSLFSQNWNNVVQTNIPFSWTSTSSIDLVTNKDGNHILVYYYTVSPTNYYLKYYLINTSGSIVRSYTFETQAVQFASIDGTDDRIYVVYKLGNNLETRKSTDAGQSWSSNIADIDIGSNTCNNVDISFGKDDNALHVVWATQDDEYGYKTYYKRLASNNSWGSTEPVTDGSNLGGFPTVSKSQNRVHVGYNTKASADPWYAGGDSKSRDKSSYWETPQTVYSNLFGPAFREKIHAGASKLFDFYYRLNTGPRADLYVRERSLSGTSWTSGHTLLQTTSNPASLLSAANTTDGKTHIVYEITGGVGYRNYNGSSWSSEEQIGNQWDFPKIYAVSNDLFSVWGGSYIYYRQYDANPLTPSNFAGSILDLGYDAHPKVTWALSNEPDVRGNTIDGYIIERSLNYAAFSPCTTLSGDTNEFIDIGVHYAGSGPGTARYRIKSRDINDHESPWSNIVSINYGNVWKAGSEYEIINVTPENFYLSPNYPNPFNPSTKINYALPEAANVQLKVYDMLGKEVATLVDETKGAGYHLVDFDASNLSSGIYIYRMTAANGEKLLFNETKRMVLMK